MSITAEYIVELFEKYVRARKRLAELLVMEPDVRLAIINAVLRDVATKEDIKELKEEISILAKTTREEFEKLKIKLAEKASKKDIVKLESEINLLRRELEKLRTELGKQGERISILETRFDNIEKRLDDFYKLMIISIIGIFITLLTTMLAKILPF